MMNALTESSLLVLVPEAADLSQEERAELLAMAAAVTELLRPEELLRQVRLFVRRRTRNATA